MKFIDRLKHNSSLYLGYSIETDFKFSEYGELLDYPMNNLGDPEDFYNPFGCHGHEVAVVDFFMNLYGLKKEEFWGYASNSSTESILHCIWRARESFKNSKPTIILSNDVAHYAIDKVSQILGLELINVSSDKYGLLDYDSLARIIKDKGATDYNYIFYAAIGSTITSSIDDVSKVRKIFQAENILPYIHADAVFDGAFLPFTDDFEKLDYFDSINISGNKFIGLPIPLGITIINRKYIEKKCIKLVANNDITISSSRDALTVYLLYKSIKKLGGKDGLRKKYTDCLARAKKYKKILEDNGFEVFKYENALTLVINQVPLEICLKWCLPNTKLTSLTCLSKLTEDKLLGFIKDCDDFKKGLFDPESKVIMPCKVESL